MVANVADRILALPVPEAGSNLPGGQVRTAWQDLALGAGFPIQLVEPAPCPKPTLSSVSSTATHRSWSATGNSNRPLLLAQVPPKTSEGYPGDCSRDRQHGYDSSVRGNRGDVR